MKTNRLISTILAMMLCMSGVSRQAQAQQPASASSETAGSGVASSKGNAQTLLAISWRGRRPGFSLVPSSSYASVKGISAATASPPAVLGSGTVGKISLWTGTSPSGNSILGDSIITQLNGNIGIGIAAPTSKLTVQGMIETTLGGYKFPDGTVQTTAAVSGLQSVTHDSTLTGEGTSGSPLGVAVPLNLIGAREPGFFLVDVTNTHNGGTYFGGNGFAAGGGPSESNYGGIGVAGIGGHSVSGTGGVGVSGQGGQSQTGLGGPGVRGFGGQSESGEGGAGISVMGGTSISGSGGVGIDAMGGVSLTDNRAGGLGLRASGAGSTKGQAGNGLEAVGGGTHSGVAGVGLVAVGGNHTGTEGASKGGNGVDAIGGASNTGFGGNGVDAIGAPSNIGFGGSGLVAHGGDFNGRGVVATGGVGSVGYGVEATGGASTGSGSTAGAGVFAKGGPSSGPNSESGFGIIAIPGEPANGAARGRAGSFEGDVFIGGHLTVVGDLDVSGSKHFKIDHPLDPENKYLLHASVESSEVLNIYSGNIVTNTKGEATVTLPEWFEPLNRDLRYQLTVIGTFAQAIVANEVRNNRFTIKTNAPSVKVSWQVTGVRSDAVMLKHPFRAVEDKPERERGTYLTPELFGKPEERGAEWARNRELMRRLKQQGPEAQQIAEFTEKKGVRH